MLDPIGGFGRIRDFFISYVETSFRISDPEAARERRRLLETAGVFAAEPFVEPVLRYKAEDRGLEEMIGDEKGPLAGLGPREAQAAFVELALSGLFDGEPAQGEAMRRSLYPPYVHQTRMLSRGVRPGSPAIVTSGTGSGKTESFMLPILASLAREAVRWPRPEEGYLSDRWWADRRLSWAPQRRGERRPAAVRALILYPMNALVEDQMVRLRRTLDSEEARAVMDRRFAGNRIFFGQYTSSAPVTGYERHPRLAGDPDEKKRRSRRQRQLRARLQAADELQAAARDYDARMERAAALRGETAEKTRFIFPALDGGEMLSRWDMQAAPPDILVTNASMLGAMLSREVEEPVFEATRRWLQENEDACFHLVFDELHLIRGSAGTEVSYLVKSLLQRLGLDDPEHRHKLRILASSASMPMEGEEGEQSKRYLRDMFAPYGTSRAAGDLGTTEPGFWSECIVRGDPEIPVWTRGQVRPEPFVELFRAAGGEAGGCIARIERSARLDAAVEAAAAALGIEGEAEGALVARLAEQAAALLTDACRDAEGVRARSVRRIAEKAFADPAQPEPAVRGLMLARALPESGAWPDAKADKATPSFRVHAFVRNIEGLFAAPALREDGRVGFAGLSVERGLSHAKPEAGQARGRRLFELLYCEACGDLLIGGQKGRRDGKSALIELLPSTPELENLPERAASEYYDRMTYDEFAVFWPSAKEPARDASGYDAWDAAALDPASGVVKAGAQTPEGWIRGHLYRQTQAAAGRRGVLTAQPFCCPDCGTDYSNRPASSLRRSPIRAFRTGVGKASQLVATELLELLHAVKAEAKSIVFSDSRQDAANQALEIERLHLRDLRREVLIAAARACLDEAAAGRLDPDWCRKEMDRLYAQGKIEEAFALYSRQKAQAGDRRVSAESRKVQVDALVYYDDQTGEVGRLAAELARLGIHPFDESGYRGWEGRPWHDAFELRDGKAFLAQWLDETGKRDLANAISKELLTLVDDVIFANTFFALEETGLAYPSVGKEAGPDVDRLDAWLRVFASATRVRENKFYDRARTAEWRTLDQVGARNRVRRFAEGAFGDAAAAEFERAIEKLAEHGHVGGIIRAGKVFLRLAEEGDPYWRCRKCERVHMHRGVGRCTRCFDPLPAEPRGRVEELWSGNFLGRRIVRGQREGVARFRLRCEELTGQTDDFSDRLRKFKGIFVDDAAEIARKAREIDLLSVTTTMEVGIDIGSLQTVYQANMPPQRFNYQQRVGRAGRRGQAYSLVVTFCRGRTHDAYYYAHPEAITGDPPPPPFLAAGHDPIPERLARKVWLRAAFKRLRDEAARRGEAYPGDLLVPPDVHGEYLPTDEYYDDPRSCGWKARLRVALERTGHERDRFIEAGCIDPGLRARLREKLTVDRLIGEIEDQRRDKPASPKGLAQFLAERGLLPMYGMPTRVRPLYLGLRAETDEGDADYDWSAIDRDLDVAVFEFAPGAILTKDKKQHKVIGFTGALAPPERQGRRIALRALSDWCESKHYVALCPQCGAGRYSAAPAQARLDCDDCGAPIDPSELKPYVTPAAFRTRFHPEPDDQDGVGRSSIRTVATMLHEGEPQDCGGLRVHRGAGVTIMQLNDGPDDGGDEPEGFTIVAASDEGVSAPGGARAGALESQAVDAQELRSARGSRWRAVSPPQTFGLIARKETDALYLELRRFDPRLTLARVARKGEGAHLPTRAAAISATQILVQKAALDLDVSPDEFEALEPRLRDGRPMLQIADALINGSGLVRRLGEARSDGTPHVVHLVREMLEDQSRWPLADFLGHDDEGGHASRCQTSCYRCIQRYGNRSYHGLLDWRLGLAYLRALVAPGYACGLEEKDLHLPECQGWTERALALAETVAGMRPHALSVEVHGPRNLPAIREVKGEGALYVVVHPLWRTDGAYGRALAGGAEARFVDTFDLERRPLRALEEASSEG